MAKNLTDVDTFPANVNVPEDGDSRNAASVEAPFQQLSNRTRNLLNRIVNNLLAESSQTIVRWIPGSRGMASDEASNGPGWLPAVGISYWGAALSIGASRSRCVYDLGAVVPNGATITQVRVRVDPQAGNTGSGRMSAQVHVCDYTGVLSSGTDTTTDTTGDAQWITIATSIVVDKATRSYQVAVRNSLDYVLDVIWGVEVTFTTTKRFID